MPMSLPDPGRQLERQIQWPSIILQILGRIKKMSLFGSGNMNQETRQRRLSCPGSTSDNRNYYGGNGNGAFPTEFTNPVRTNTPLPPRSRDGTQSVKKKAIFSFMSCAFQFILYCGRFMLIVSSALVVFSTQKKAEIYIPYDPAPPGGSVRRPFTVDQQGDPLGPSTSGPTPSPPADTTAVKKEDPKDSEDIVKRLQAFCTDADPTSLYRSLVKINEGASGDIFTACQVGTNISVSIKLMDLAKQPRKDLVFNEILAMRGSRHPNIVDYID
jgi:hypothetical protein